MKSLFLLLIAVSSTAMGQEFNVSPSVSAYLKADSSRVFNGLLGVQKIPKTIHTMVRTGDKWYRLDSIVELALQYGARIEAIEKIVGVRADRVYDNWYGGEVNNRIRFRRGAPSKIISGKTNDGNIFFQEPSEFPINSGHRISVYSGQKEVAYMNDDSTWVVHDDSAALSSISKAYQATIDMYDKRLREKQKTIDKLQKLLRK